MIILEITLDNTEFAQQFSSLNKTLTPIISDFVEGHGEIGDNIILFYFAGIVKEMLKSMDDDDIKEAVMRFMLD